MERKKLKGILLYNIPERGCQPHKFHLSVQLFYVSVHEMPFVHYIKIIPM